MESSALRSFQYSVGPISTVKCLPEKPGLITMPANWSTASKSYVQCLTIGSGLSSHSKGRNLYKVLCVKTSEASATSKASDGTAEDLKEKVTLQSVTFPSAFQELLLEICDETEIAEVKLKIGEYEMHVKRNVGVTKPPVIVPSPTTPPPIPSEPMEKSVSAAPPPASPKHSPEKVNPFTNVSFGKSSKLAALEASGANGYVAVPSPSVGIFRRGRTLKGKKQPPSCKEGDLLKEGQIIGWVDQFGTELPVRSDIGGEVLKLLVDDGEAVGYGDPLIAVLPSFPGINK